MTIELYVFDALPLSYSTSKYCRIVSSTSLDDSRKQEQARVVANFFCLMRLASDRASLHFPILPPECLLQILAFFS